MKTLIACLLLGTTAMAAPRSKLATEKLTGTVVSGGRMYSSEAAARAGKVGASGAVRVVRVVRDRGDVVEVSTAAISDCIANAHGMNQKFTVTVFVRRDELVPRLATAIVTSFPDRTAIAIDRGALISVTKDGMAWRESVLNEAYGAPPDDVVYSMTKYKASALPAASLGKPYVCPGGQPLTFDAWRALPYDERGDVRYPPYCIVSSYSRFTEDDPPRELPKPKPPTVNGRAIQGPDTWGDAVYRDGSHYLADVLTTCAKLRIRPDDVAVQPWASDVGTPPPPPWPGTTFTPRSGSRVFWPDGRPAGTYQGTAAMYGPDIKETETSVCRPSFADEPLCFRKRDVVIRLGGASRL